MSTWTSDELDRIGAAEELEIASVRRDGTLRNPVTIWVVRHGDGADYSLEREVEDVRAAYSSALAAGSMEVAEPRTKPWGQTVAYVRDPDGVLVEIGDEVPG